MSDKLKVLIVGAGDMGRTHSRAYGRREDVAICAVADLDTQRAERLAGELQSAKPYADCRDALERERPDLVSVCVPACSHAEVAIWALQAGASVLSEKPIALTPTLAESMIAAAKGAKGKLGVIFQRRFQKVWQEVRERLPKLGGPVTYVGSDYRPVRPKVLMHSRSGNGGPIIDCCVHEFDMMQQLFGPAKRVFATGAIYAQGKKELAAISDLAVDTASITLDFEGGHRGLLSYTWGLPTGFAGWGTTELLGPNGAVKVFGNAIECHVGGAPAEKVEELGSDGHAAQIAAYVEALKAGRDVPVNPEEALSALRVAHAALKSIETGSPVTL